ncbi:haloacid dehalogenase type II [Flavobacterium taihuense]|uniref:Haloacid dehalogenase type II n=1 Tax=Flavobacterium taihuense TaxID=2857508 RepID=A0ABS6XW94_9FLAO|nr:haloacid dehalogenase type II [Flavobacterium taihuense]MBW4360637.1 haloacid dehalogenase type II [Flavobacterium taihuense]
MKFINSTHNSKESLLNRRSFISNSMLTLGYVMINPINMYSKNKISKIKAIAFDGFVIFNPKPVQDLVYEIFPEKGAEFISIWRSKQFEYTWLRTSSNKYKNFWEVTEDALNYTLKKTGLALSNNKRQQLMDCFLNLKIWPEVLDGLKILKINGIRLAFLSNFTNEMMMANLKKNEISDYFDFLLSTDQVNAFKPSPLAYQMGIDAFKLEKSDILFAAFGAWDASGAKMFNYKTFWVNRLGVPMEELDVVPDGVGSNFNDLISFLKL